jgi:hypothetical protein
VTIVTLLYWWPEYAGDALFPRLRKVIRETLALAPGGSAAGTEEGIQLANAETMRLLAEILEVADDAQVEGRTAVVNPNAIVEAAGTLRRIANRLASVSIGRIVAPSPAPAPSPDPADKPALASITTAHIDPPALPLDPGPSRRARRSSRRFANSFRRGSISSAATRASAPAQLRQLRGKTYPTILPLTDALGTRIR